MEVNVSGSKTKLQLDPSVFDQAFNEGLVHQVVVAYMNSARTGNSAQKTRSEVRGGGKKPWKQKGTGRARAGTIRSPIWRAGGVTFASKKRDYSQRLNRKMYKKAICAILSELTRTESISFVSDFKCKTHKTKDFLAQMDKLKRSNALVVLSEVEESAALASRNLKDFDVCDVKALDPVSLLRYDALVMTSEAAKKLEEQLQ